MNHVAGPNDRGAITLRATASLMALLVAGMYAAIGAGGVPDDFQSPPALVMLAAAGCYLVGSVAVWRVGRRLLVAGALANAIVMLLFVGSAIRGHSTVDWFTLGGKSVQVLLEAGLLLLIRADLTRSDTPVPHSAPPYGRPWLRFLGESAP